MGKPLAWLISRASSVAWACGGVLFGLALSTPIGWHLPETIANLLGGVIGAIASVAGAMLVVKRQLDAEEVRLKVQRDLDDASAEARTSAMCRALANALWTDINSVRALIAGQAELAEKKVYNGKYLEKESDFAEWCLRMELAPMASFDKFSHLLHHLGAISPSLIHAYADVLRYAAICRGQRTTRTSDRECVELVPILAAALPALDSNLADAQVALVPFMIVAMAER